jgi:hypothetical protein
VYVWRRGGGLGDGDGGGEIWVGDDVDVVGVKVEGR